MSHPASRTMNQTPSVRRGRAGLIVLWAAQVLLAAAFIFAGGSKLAGVPAMVALFDAIGVGQWFRYATGLIEVSAAIALLVPAFSAFGAVALVATMIGAVATHLFIIRGSPAAPLLLLLLALVIAWARRDQLLAALSRRRSTH